MRALRRLDGYDGLKPLLDASDEDTLVRLGGPMLARIPGTAGGGRARLVSCLLHGNEDSGYRAVLEILRSGARFPFDLWVLVGNVEAASTGGWFVHRYLDSQEDFNRVWDRRPPDTPQRRIASEALDVLRAEPLEAALDLHNTTGANPSHAIVPGRSSRGDALGAVCSDLILRWRLEAHTLMQALSPVCPAIAVECGIAGAVSSTENAARVLHRFLSARSFPDEPPPVPVFEMRERVVVRPGIAFDFGPLRAGLDLALQRGLDAYNFETLPAGTRLGQTRGGPVPLQSFDMRGRDVTRETFAVTDGRALVLARDVVPVMMTRTVPQTRRDCLFYVAHRA